MTEKRRLVKKRQNSFNVDSTEETDPPSPQNIKDLQTGTDPSWSEVCQQFEVANLCCSTEEFVRQRQAFLALWTLHVVSTFQKQDAMVCFDLDV